MKVIYTQDVFYYDNLEKWVSLPYEIYERTQKEPVTEEITKLTAILDDELGREFAFPIPKSITGGRQVFLSTLVAIREHLPKKRLQDGILPLLVYREGKHPDALYLPKWYH